MSPFRASAGFTDDWQNFDFSLENIVARTGRTPVEAEHALEAMTPLGRLLEPGEVAAAVVFLASPEAAAINGQALVLDGGGFQS